MEKGDVYTVTCGGVSSPVHHKCLYVYVKRINTLVKMVWAEMKTVIDLPSLHIILFALFLII